MLRPTWLELHARWLGIRGEMARRAGRYEAAERLVQQALAQVAQAHRMDGALGVLLLNRLGMIGKHRAQYRDGARAYLRALRTARRRFGREHPTIATLYHNLGGLEHARGRSLRACRDRRA